MFGRRRKNIKDTQDTLRDFTELAGDRFIAPGAGTWLVVLGGLAVGAAAACVAVKRRKNKKAAR
jgi:hypothetical protein